MKFSILIATLLGFAGGVLVTSTTSGFSSHDETTDEYEEARKEMNDSPDDPFSYDADFDDSSEMDASDDAFAEANVLSGEETTSFGLRKMDPNDFFERSLIISNWQWDMHTLASSLEFHTGHQFKPAGKAHAKPTETLREHLEFMEEFEKESQRLNKLQEEGE